MAASGTKQKTASTESLNGQAPKRRSNATTMAAAQKEISVSEFFAKNRHLLGFDNPRKALLTTVKEAVDNSLDACEEAGILPEIWVHIEQTGAAGRYKVGIQDNGPGILKKQIPLIFGKLLYGSQVPPPAAKPRAAGHRHLGRRHVRRADDRQAGEDHLEGLDPQAGPLLRDPDRHQEERAQDSQRQGATASTSRPARRAPPTSRSTASSGSTSRTARA